MSVGRSVHASKALAKKERIPMRGGLFIFHPGVKSKALSHQEIYTTYKMVGAHSIYLDLISFTITDNHCSINRSHKDYQMTPFGYNRLIVGSEQSNQNSRVPGKITKNPLSPAIIVAR